MKARTIFPVIIIALGALLVIVPSVIFPPCASLLELAGGNTVPMKCHWMQVAASTVGAIVAVHGIVLWVRRKKEMHAVDYLAPAACGIVEILLANILIGACKGATMACVMGTKPAINSLAVLLIAAASAGAIREICARKKGHRKSEQRG